MAVSVEDLERSKELYQEGRDALASGDRSRGIEKLTNSYKLAPHFKTFELLGEALSEAGENREAVLYLAAAAGLGNRQSRPMFLLAKVLLGLGEAWKAAGIEMLQRCISVNPNYSAAKNLLQELQTGQGHKPDD